MKEEDSVVRLEVMVVGLFGCVCVFALGNDIGGIVWQMIRDDGFGGF